MSVTKEQRAEWDRMLELLRPIEVAESAPPAPRPPKPKRERKPGDDVVVLLELGAPVGPGWEKYRDK